MRAHRTPAIVFSSTAAVYGEPERTPISETDPPRPTSPYGASKLAVDTALAEHARMHGTAAVSLRYFNVAGAHADAAGRWYGERHVPETHLIPNVLAVASGADGPDGHVALFGDDYPTPDGTGIRDYVHVVDLAAGHLRALEALDGIDGCLAVNLGTGQGHSVLDVVRAASAAVGRELPYEVLPRRPGDVACTYADPSRAAEVLGWRAQRGLEEMCRDHWNWQHHNPDGYAEDRPAAAS
jgi:UDP-glucose 4-epimerase